MQLTIGGDPEIFVIDPLSGEVIAAQGVVKGSKRNPFATPNGFIHRDNVLAEMNIDPATTAHEFADNVEGILGDLRDMLAVNDKTIGIISSHIMDPKYLQHYEAKRFFCNPNLNCWDADFVNKPNAHVAGNLRTAAGHIHIGCEYTEEEQQNTLAKSCEIHMGLPSVAFDQDTLRRSLYGIAGSYREKPYGIEYTVISNFWLSSRNTMQWIFKRAAESVANIHKVANISDDMAEDIQATINNCDIEQAKALCEHLDIAFPEVA